MPCVPVTSSRPPSAVSRSRLCDNAAMRKTDKHRERQIIDALNTVCERALERSLPGFTWLTHHVDYQRFPNSLSVFCIVEGNAPDSEAWLVEAVCKALRDCNIPLPSSRCHCLSEASYQQRFG